MKSELPAGILIIENTDTEKDIILKLESLNEANNTIKESLNNCVKRLDAVKQILSKI
jgi:hypothetical protein